MFFYYSGYFEDQLVVSNKINSKPFNNRQLFVNHKTALVCITLK